MLKILIQGWTKYPHSYSLVNVYQILALCKNPNVKIILQEEPPFREEWKSYKDLSDLVLTKSEQDILDSLKRYDMTKQEEIDIIYRITYPFCISSDKSVPGIPITLFYTAEFQQLKNEFFVGGTFAEFRNKCVEHTIYPTTPSSWSALALRPYNYIPRVIHHGIDSTKFYPYDTGKRDECRTNFLNDCGFHGQENSFTFLTVGAMTGNKNIIGIIKAWYRLTFIHDSINLILKGIGDLYTCQKYINDAVKQLKNTGIINQKHWKKVRHRLIYIDKLYSYSELCQLYNSVDCYLSPYIAEGFNLPVLEAVACGLPVIVSKGGSTDDFVLDTFAKHPVTVPCKTETGEQILLVDDTSLQETMMAVVSDKEFVKEARENGPKYVQSKFTWDIVADRLLAFFSAVLDDYNYHIRGKILLRRT